MRFCWWFLHNATVRSVPQRGRELTGIGWGLNSSSPHLSPPLSLSSSRDHDQRRLIEFVSLSASTVTGITSRSADCTTGGLISTLHNSHTSTNSGTTKPDFVQQWGSPLRHNTIIMEQYFELKSMWRGPRGWHQSITSQIPATRVSGQSLVYVTS